MQQRLINSPSLANCDLLEMEHDISLLAEAGVQFFHIDLMDGHYVPNLGFPMKIISNLKNKYPQAIADVHIMVEHPERYVEPLAKEGADYVSFHIDSTPFVIRTLQSIRKQGMKCGVVINPSQRIDLLEPYLDQVDMVTVMSVEPGYAGQQFMESALPRLHELDLMRRNRNLDFLITIDGGINYKNVKPCVVNGANVFVTGIYTVFNQPDGIVSACKRFELELQDGLRSITRGA